MNDHPLAALVAAIPEPALLLDPAGTVMAANDLARRFLGAGAASPQGKALTALVSLTGSSALALNEIARLSFLRALEGEVEAEEAHGLLSTRKVTLSIGALPGTDAAPGRAGYLAILRDVNEERRKEQVRITQEKLASISQLASGVAHEFNNIMASLYGFAQLAQGDPAFNEELISAVQQYAERSKEITRRLRSFSLEGQGPLEIVFLPDVIDKVVERFAGELAEASITVERRYERVSETLVHRREIEEALETLVANARRAIVKSGVITIDVRSADRAIEVRISDTGYGIPKEHLTRVFEPFFTLKQTTDTVKPGAGLGLAAAYNYVRRHQGEIFAESEIGKGTRFTIRLPVRLERRRREPSSPAAAPVERRRPDAPIPRSILCVDDEESMVRLLESILVDHRVVSARSGREAVAALNRKGPFDYVILDLVIPGELDGYAVFEEIQKRERGAKVILLTGLVEDEQVKDAAARAYGYLRKPFGIKDLSTLIV